MLRELHIRNYAVIERLDLELPEGLVVFTGETGAGKSIIIGALALALGGRAQAEQVRGGASEIQVHARFAGPLPLRAVALMEESGLPVEEDLIVRRVIPAGGKSRAWVNETPASAAALERIGRELVDIHGQHQHQTLLRTETHLDYLDDFLKLGPARDACRDLFGKWTGLRGEKSRLEAREREKSQRLDYLSFQKEEIEKSGLRPGEDRELEEQKEILRHSERLAEAAAAAGDLLYSGEKPASEAVHLAGRKLEELAAVDSALAPISRLLDECQVRLEEAGREIQEYGRRLETNPEMLREVEDRLAEINRLKRKYGGSVDEVLRTLEEVREEMRGIEEGGERLAEIAGELPGLTSELASAAADLSARREKGRGRLEKRILNELGLIGLKGSTFSVALSREEDEEEGVEVDGRRLRCDERGIDGAEFLLSANPGEDPRPLARVASGGELSRVMLAIKSVLSEVDRIETLVFDEVDIGIGGKTARLVGDRLKGISRGRQVLCVTHLPQIASLGDSHYNIRKSTRAGRAHIEVQSLDGRERVEEVARMLGGRAVTAATRKHAAEMLRDGS